MAKVYTDMAICYDFDGTLSPGNMQEYDFIPQLNLKSNAFWEKVTERCKDSDADNILAYMQLMLEEANAKSIPITKEAITQYGQKIVLFSGVGSFFNRINDYAKERKVMVKHFVISSGLREMIKGSPIAEYFEKIYASSYIYDANDVAKWPALAVNYTTKTQFLFRINKGVLDVWDNRKINDYVPMQDRVYPFNRMVFIGDGSTDVPCMKLVKQLGGHSIAVYKPRSSMKTAVNLLGQERVNFIAPADYKEGTTLDKQIKAIIDKVAADAAVEKLERASRSSTAKTKKVPS